MIENHTYINMITTFIPHSFTPCITVIMTATEIYNLTLSTGMTRKMVTSDEIIHVL